MKSLPVFKCAIAATWAALSFAAPAQAGVLLTDTAVFSANNQGENWNGMIWNTQGAPDDRWNLYYSSSMDSQNPIFLNSDDNENSSIAIDLDPGTHNFLIFGDSGGVTPLSDQHFVVNLYFAGNQGAPDISGLYGLACPVICAGSHGNGLDLFGASGLDTPNAQEAGTLVYIANGYRVELTAFTWDVHRDIDAVWPHWDNTIPHNSGNGQPDFVGALQLRVTAVPAPAALGVTLFIGGFMTFAARGLRRRAVRFSGRIPI